MIDITDVPMFTLIDSKIREAFSNAAVRYDVLTGLHKEIGRDLIKKAKREADPQYVLDIGMGTGWLTRRLTHYFPGSKVVGLDFASGMTAVARNQDEDFRIVQADACHLPFRENIFDLIISNLAFQWIEDLPAAFQACHASLKDTGMIYLAMFGHGTLKELFISLEQTMPHKSGKGLSIQRLASREKIEAALREANFSDGEISEERIHAHFPSMMDLLRWLQAIGANALRRDSYIGRDWLMRASEYYDQNFRDRLGVTVTFEVFWIFAGHRSHVA